MYRPLIHWINEGIFQKESKFDRSGSFERVQRKPRQRDIKQALAHIVRRSMWRAKLSIKIDDYPQLRFRNRGYGHDADTTDFDAACNRWRAGCKKCSIGSTNDHVI